MSFGFGVGDFIAVGTLCWKVYKKVKESPGNYKELASEVSGLFTVIEETKELLSQQETTTAQQAKLRPCKEGCEAVLNDLNGLLTKYESLGTKSQRTFDRIGMGFEDMAAIRLRLISNVSMLDAFNNVSSHARLEKKLNLLITEVRAGKREGSVVSIQTFNSAAHRDQETWDALRRELEDIGISPGVIVEKRQYIVTWFQDAVAAGQLEEDAPSEGADDSAYTSDHPSDQDERELSTEPPEALGFDRGPSDQDQEESSPGLAKSLVYQREVSGSSDVARNIFSHSNDKAEMSQITQRPQKPKKTRSMGDRIFGLLSSLRSPDTQLLVAIRAQDDAGIRLALEKGANIENQNTSEFTMLSAAVDTESVPIVQRLLDLGAFTQSQRGVLPLVLAAVRGHVELVGLLLDAGANIEAISRIGTPLIAAAVMNEPKVVALLLDRGANIESILPDDLEPVFNFMISKNVACLRQLGPAKTQKGFTALNLAAIMRHVEIVQLLADRGADLDGRNPFGLTALMEAAGTDKVEVVRVLVKMGANVTLTNDYGETALAREEKMSKQPMLKSNTEEIMQILRDATETPTHTHGTAI